jgi:hypothetical protein
MLSQAEQYIGYIHGFLKSPDEEDWKRWRPLIARSCKQITNEEFRKQGIETMRILDYYFSVLNKSKHLRILSNPMKAIFYGDKCILFDPMHSCKNPAIL